MTSMILISAAQCRAARALLGWTQRELETRARISKKAIADFERGASTPYVRTMRDLIETFETAGIEFIVPQQGVGGVGVRLKWGFEEPTRVGTTQGDLTHQGGGKGGLDAMDWEALDDFGDAGEPAEDNEPLPPLDWTDEDRTEQIEHWRSRPEKWAALHEISRQCLLRAMGVDSLGAE